MSPTRLGVSRGLQISHRARRKRAARAVASGYVSTPSIIALYQRRCQANPKAVRASSECCGNFPQALRPGCTIRVSQEASIGTSIAAPWTGRHREKSWVDALNLPIPEGASRSDLQLPKRCGCIHSSQTADDDRFSPVQYCRRVGNLPDGEGQSHGSSCLQLSSVQQFPDGRIRGSGEPGVHVRGA